MKDKQLEGKVVLVTGGGRGWGRAVCIAFARQGAKVIIVSRTESEINETARLIKNEGGEAFPVSVNLSNTEEIDQLVEHINSTFKGVDILVNNAAVLILKTFEEMTSEEVELTLKVNLHSYIYLCKKLIPAMIEKKSGSIINVSSNAGIWAFSKESIYTACKFAIEGFTKSLAIELKEYGIPVNTITPGATDLGLKIKPTSITQDDFEKLSEEDKSVFTDSILYTEAFIYLALPENCNLTGERILAYELSNEIREKGWKVPYTRRTQQKPEYLREV